MAQVQLIARHTMMPGQQDEVLSALSELIAAARKEPGNLAFDVYRSVEDELSYVLLERYASREALAAHRDTPHFRTYLLDRIAPRLSCRTIEEYDVRD
jgi:quinol monooxygenase YgiN